MDTVDFASSEAPADSPPRVAIVTGASSGVGWATAVALAGEGYASCRC